MKLTELALRREVKVLVVFGIAASIGYYYWLKKKKAPKTA
jgi:hypothetical protein